MFFKGKGAFLIAGYNTMPKKKKEQVDIRGLCRLMGKFMFYIAGTMLLFIVNILTDDEIWAHIAGVMIAAGCISLVIYANTGNRFVKKGNKK